MGQLNKMLKLCGLILIFYIVGLNCCYRIAEEFLNSSNASVSTTIQFHWTARGVWQSELILAIGMTCFGDGFYNSTMQMRKIPAVISTLSVKRMLLWLVLESVIKGLCHFPNRRRRYLQSYVLIIGKLLKLIADFCLFLTSITQTSPLKVTH